MSQGAIQLRKFRGRENLLQFENVKGNSIGIEKPIFGVWNGINFTVKGRIELSVQAKVVASQACLLLVDWVGLPSNSKHSPPSAIFIHPFEKVRLEKK